MFKISSILLSSKTANFFTSNPSTSKIAKSLDGSNGTIFSCVADRIFLPLIPPAHSIKTFINSSLGFLQFSVKLNILYPFFTILSIKTLPPPLMSSTSKNLLKQCSTFLLQFSLGQNTSPELET